MIQLTWWRSLRSVKIAIYNKHKINNVLSASTYLSPTTTRDAVYMQRCQNCQRTLAKTSVKIHVHHHHHSYPSRQLAYRAATKLLHPCLSLAKLWVVSQLWFIFVVSASTGPRHVVFGRCMYIAMIILTFFFSSSPSSPSPSYSPLLPPSLPLSSSSSSASSSSSSSFSPPPPLPLLPPLRPFMTYAVDWTL